MRLLTLTLLIAATLAAQTATLVLRNGRIVTWNDGKPEAQAIAIQGDTILAVGSNAEIQKHAGPATKTIDLGGKLAIPGFIEGHGHFMGIGQSMVSLNLMKTKSWDEIVAMVGDAARKAKPGEWIVGRGWHQEKWDKTPRPNVEGFPTHDTLSAASPQNPVLLTHASGHASFANQKAMEMADVNAATPNPPGGEILKDAQGRPIGAFRETASGLLQRAMRKSRETMTPRQLEEEQWKMLGLADREVTSKGITSFQDAGSPFTTIDFFRKAAAEGKLNVRLWVMVRDSLEQQRLNLAKYRGVDKQVTVRGIKHSIDGALGPRGAWLLAPYEDLKTSTGLNTTPLETIRESARLAMQHGYQLCVHAIGDRANRETLDIMEKALGGKKDARWRVEHAQHLHPADIPRFGKLGVIASMQGIHCTSDAPYVLARLGAKRAEEGAYVWQKLMKSGAVVTNGSDAPVEDVDPIASFYATVSRRLKDGSVFHGAERMSRMEALKSYTIHAAYAAFEEKQKGSLEPGKLADIVVLSKDILKVAEEEIPSAKVTHTIIGGRLVYESPR
ncbi:MAG: amidohydrolase [Bryobacteraceae bacterium]|nr:amidohydrolase [Bryobacteraceae bacterium]